MKKIAIVGFGFSGLMLLAHLARETKEPLEIYVIGKDLSGRGIAYSTENLEHLLNVPAGKMFAFPDDELHFIRWLSSPEGKAAVNARGLNKQYSATDFVPRAIYGDYLHEIWHQAQLMAAQKKLTIKMVQAKVTAVTVSADGFAVGTDRGDAIAVDRVVITTGNEDRPVLPQLDSSYIIQCPWAPGALSKILHSNRPVTLLGTGLTAVDIMLSLRSEGYGGQIIGISRRGLLPQSHKPNMKPYALDEAALRTHKSLGKLMQFVRSAIRKHEKAGGDWREVIDALRPHTQALWTHLSLRDQQKFLARLLPYWNVHRHRMAPEIGAKLAKEIGNGGVRIFSCHDVQASMEGSKAKLELITSRGAKKLFYPTAIVNCIGPELRLHPNGQNLFKQMVADKLAEPAPIGIGLATDPHGRLFGDGYPNLYAVGSLRTGQLLESTAVPELRVQAADTARAVLTV